MAIDQRTLTPHDHTAPQLPNNWATQAGLVVGTAALVIALVATATMARSPAIALAPVVATILAVATLRMPGAVFAAFLYIPFYKSAVQPAIPIDITPILAALSLILCVPLVIDSRRYMARTSVILWTALLALIALGSLYAPDSQQAARDAATFLLLVFLPCLLGVRVAREERLQQQFLWFSVGLSLLVTVVGVMQLGSVSATERLTVLGDNTIGAGRAAMIFPLVGLTMSQRVPKPFRPVFWLLIPASILVAFSTGSRGPIVMGVLAMVLVGLASGRNFGKRLAGVLALVIGAVFLAQLPAVQHLVPQRSLERMESLLVFVLPSNGSSGGIDTSTSARLQLFALAGDMFQQRPYLGFGTSSYQWWAEHTAGIAEQTYPHNLLLQFAAEYGLIGLVLCLAIIAVAMIHGLGYTSHRLGSPLMMLGTFALLNSFVSSGLIDNRWLWGMLVMMMALPRVSETTARRVTTAPDGTSPAQPAHPGLVGGNP